MITKDELNALIPHGKRRKVAELAGVTSSAVTNFFNGKTKESHKILKAAMQVAIECKKDIAPLEAELSELKTELTTA